MLFFLYSVITKSLGASGSNGSSRWSIQTLMSSFLELAKAGVTHGTVMSYDILWLVQLSKDIFGQDFAQLNAHLVCMW